MPRIYIKIASSRAPSRLLPWHRCRASPAVCSASSPKDRCASAGPRPMGQQPGSKKSSSAPWPGSRRFFWQSVSIAPRVVAPKRPPHARGLGQGPHHSLGVSSRYHIFPRGPFAGVFIRPVLVCSRHRGGNQAASRVTLGLRRGHSPDLPPAKDVSSTHDGA